MAAIPVPVHFDGHNINIITEDSPSTCKNRVKGINFGPGQKPKQKKRRNGNGKTQILNKRAPGDSGSVASPSEGDANSVNLSPSNNKENIEQNDNVLSPLTTNEASMRLTPSPAPAIDTSDETKTSNDGVESSESMTTTSLKPIELNAANLAKNPFTKRSNNASNINNNTLSPAPMISNGSNNNLQNEGTKNKRASSPGLPLPPRQQFKPQQNGALNKRKSPRLPVPFNPNQPQPQQPIFEGQNILNTMTNSNNHVLTQQNINTVPSINAITAEQTAALQAQQQQAQQQAFNGLPQAIQSAVIDGGIGGLPQQLLQQQMVQHNGILNPEEFGSHDDIGFDDEDEQNQGKDRQNLYKTELCREWSTSGWCYYNKRCSFAHGLQELRPVFRSKKWRTKRCRNWHTTGYCPYEHRCQFLHDQSPPRRISDYATANARALVAAQQRMQPLYFHYQVDCDRNETSDDQGDDDNTKTKGASSIADTQRQSTINDINPNTPSIGPRLKRKGFNVNQLTQKTHLSPNQNGNGSNPAGIPPTPTGAMINSPVNALLTEHMDASNRDIPLPFKGSKVRMMPIGKKGKVPIAQPPTLNIPAPSANEKEMHHIPPRYQKQSQPKTPTSDASGSPEADASKSIMQNGKLNGFKTEKKKKKGKKDAVITPFNPVQHYQSQQYELTAAQHLGLYDARTAGLLPQVPVQAGHLPVASLHAQGAVPQLNTVVPGMGHIPLSMPGSNIHNAFPGLPPSIDPGLYLSLTPSPPASPANGPKAPTTNPMLEQTAAQRLQQQQQQALMARTLAIHQAGQIPDLHQLNVQQAPEITPITPSPPLPLTMDPMAQHQQAQLALAKQQETLHLLQSKVHQVHSAQEQQNAAAAMLLQRGLNNKSATPVPPIGGDLLQSLLPTDDNVTEDTKIKPGLPLPPLPVPPTITSGKDAMFQDETKETEHSPDEELSGFRSKSKDNPKTSSSSVPNTGKKPSESTKNLPPIPPIPPPLQLQTSINSVVTGAVAAATAVTPTAANGLVPMTPTLVDSQAPGMFGFPGATTTTKQTTTTQTVVTPTTSAVPTIVSGTGVIPTTLIPSIPQQLVAYTHPHTTAGLVPVDVTYAQQHAAHAHAHAHAYAAAQAQAQAQVHGVHAVPTYAATQAQHVTYGHTVQVPVASQYGHAAPAAQYGHIGIQQIPIQSQMGYAAQTFYAPSPDFIQDPQQTYHTTGYAQYQQPPRHHYQ